MLRRLQQVIFEHIKEQASVYFLVALIFTAGIVAGALSIRMLGETQVRELNEFFFGFVDYLTEQQPINQGLIIRRSLLNNARYITVFWLCGNLFFGFIPVLLLLFYRGFTIGFTVGFLAEQNSVRGVIFAAGAVLPQNLFYVPGMIFAAVCAVVFSSLLLRRRFAGKTFPYGSYFFQFSLLMIFSMALLALGSIVEAVVTPVFMKAVIMFL